MGNLEGSSEQTRAWGSFQKWPYPSRYGPGTLTLICPFTHAPAGGRQLWQCGRDAGCEDACARLSPCPGTSWPDLGLALTDALLRESGMVGDWEDLRRGEASRRGAQGGHGLSPALCPGFSASFSLRPVKHAERDFKAPNVNCHASCLKHLRRPDKMWRLGT